jgi:hypothetical protein
MLSTLASAVSLAQKASLSAPRNRCPDDEAVNIVRRSRLSLGTRAELLLLVEKVEKDRHDISERVVSLQYVKARFIALPRNQYSSEWRLRLQPLRNRAEFLILPDTAQ